MLDPVLMIATGLNGLLAGASLDQSIKQVPSRHHIGASNYARYIRGADLASGVLWYAVLANAATLATIAAAAIGWREQVGDELRWLLLAGAIVCVAHSAATLGAAPKLFASRKLPLEDETSLARLFDGFARWQAVRAMLQLTAFLFTLFAVRALTH